jgi:peptidylprolyl isomerase
MIDAISSRTRRVLALSLAGLALSGGLVACGGDDSDSGSGSGSGTAAETATPDNAAALKDTSKAPPLPDRTGGAPAELQTRDVVQGKGPKAKAGDQLSMQYTGWVYDTGEQFDSSWDRNQPFDFQLGSGNVIPGWDKGIAGMQVGGRRVLTIPAKDAYGAQGSPPSIPPNAALIFVVDLTKIG